MNIPEYVTKDEVKLICKQLKLRDWTQLKEPSVTDKEAAIILKIVNTQGMKIRVEDFRQGLEVELEHGTRFEDANVTNNHPVLTGRIVIAHLKESMDYYRLLDVAELRGDLLKAIQSKNLDKIVDKYKKLNLAQGVLNKSIADQLK